MIGWSINLLSISESVFFETNIYIWIRQNHFFFIILMGLFSYFMPYWKETLQGKIGRKILLEIKFAWRFSSQVALSQNHFRDTFPGLANKRRVVQSSMNRESLRNVSSELALKTSSNTRFELLRKRERQRRDINQKSKMLKRFSQRGVRDLRSRGCTQKL